MKRKIIAAAAAFALALTATYAFAGPNSDKNHPDILGGGAAFTTLDEQPCR
jgi:hypothetical protein